MSLKQKFNLGQFDGKDYEYWKFYSIVIRVELQKENVEDVKDFNLVKSAKNVRDVKAVKDIKDDKKFYQICEGGLCRLRWRI